MSEAKRLNVGLFSFTGCEGCMITFIEILNDKLSEWEGKINFKYAKLLQENNTMDGFDVVFIEGAISSKEEENRIKEIRKKTKYLVSVGSCAISGAPSNHRNFFTEEQLKRIDPILKRNDLFLKVFPISKFVKVDKEINGCPMIDNIFIETLEEYFKEFGVD